MTPDPDPESAARRAPEEAEALVRRVLAVFAWSQAEALAEALALVLAKEAERDAGRPAYLRAREEAPRE